MKYLLDTHAFLWSLFEPKELSKTAVDIISDNKHEIYVSTVSLWEISLKFSIGKLGLEHVTPQDLPGYARESGFEILNIDEQIVSSFHQLPRVEHCDPFDRMLIWQAIRSNLSVISGDFKFQDYIEKGLHVVWK
jgi:PIN domain nuclease of toxin-antitoxin system